MGGTFRDQTMQIFANMSTSSQDDFLAIYSRIGYLQGQLQVKMIYSCPVRLNWQTNIRAISLVHVYRRNPTPQPIENVQVSRERQLFGRGSNEIFVLSGGNKNKRIILYSI